MEDAKGKWQVASGKLQIPVEKAQPASRTRIRNSKIENANCQIQNSRSKGAGAKERRRKGPREKIKGRF